MKFLFGDLASTFASQTNNNKNCKSVLMFSNKTHWFYFFKNQQKKSHSKSHSFKVQYLSSISRVPRCGVPVQCFSCGRPDACHETEGDL